VEFRIDDAVGNLVAEGLFDTEICKTDEWEAVLREPGCANYLEFLARNPSLLHRAGVKTIGITFEDQKQRLNGDGVFHIHPNDCAGFSRERLCAILGVDPDSVEEDTQRNLPAVGQDADTSARRPAGRMQGQIHSRLLGALRLLDPIIPPHAANGMARKLSSTAFMQLEEETEAAMEQRDKIAAWFVARAGRFLGKGSAQQNLTARPTDSLHTKFNIFKNDGEYSGYSLKISPLPPFRLTLMRSEKTGDQWKTTVVFDKPVSEIARSFSS